LHSNLPLIYLFFADIQLRSISFNKPPEVFPSASLY
jgi:hypothetical protein